MDHSSSVRASAVLRALADLAPSTEAHTPGLAVPTDWFQWLPIGAVRLFHPGAYVPRAETWVEEMAKKLASNEKEHRAVTITIDRQFGERLAAVDQIRAERRSLRVGWLFVAGRTENEDGRARRVFHPLVTIPVRVQRPPAVGRALLLPAGDAEISELVTDREVRHQLEAHIEFGGGALEGLTGAEAVSLLLPKLERLQRYARSLAIASGLPATKVVPASDGPDGLMRRSPPSWERRSCSTRAATASSPLLVPPPRASSTLTPTSPFSRSCSRSQRRRPPSGVPGGGGGRPTSAWPSSSRPAPRSPRRSSVPW